MPPEHLLIGGRRTARLSRDAELVISGIAGRFPNAHTAKEFVDQLLAGVNLCDEEDARGTMVAHPEIPRLSGTVYDLDLADAGCFGLHPYRALFMDPMTRILLEQVTMALFDAGINPRDLRGTRTGVYIGVCTSEYELLMYRKKVPGVDFIRNITRSMIAQWVSFVFQLDGPAYTCDTACSSGMYATELAYRSILEGRCDQAIIGGTNMCLDPFLTLQFARLGVLNMGTGCRPFDEGANGYTRSEGMVALLLQKREVAKRVYAQLVHAQTNADGFKSQGITFPSYEGQMSVLADVYSEAQVATSEIGFLEAHGTGTRVGDPEELSVIDNFFKPTPEKALLIGSVKGNIGHTEPVAGPCSIVKVLHAMQFGQIPPNIHFDDPKHGVDALADKRLKVVTKVTPFPVDKQYAGINCFGFGGANAHVILKKLETKNPANAYQSPIVYYSGRTKEAIDAIHEHLMTTPELESIALMQEYFKQPCDTHMYRGFTLLNSKQRSCKRVLSTSTPTLHILLGKFSNIDQFKDLLQIPLMNTILCELDAVVKEICIGTEPDPSTILQLVLIKTLMMLDLRAETLEDDCKSDLITQYFKGNIEYAELAAKLLTDKSIMRNTPNGRVNAVSLWGKRAGKYGTKGSLFVFGNCEIGIEKLSETFNVLVFNEKMRVDDFLYNLGRLHEEGLNPQIYKLYLESKFPVSTGTSMLGHLVKWQHRKYPIQMWSKSSNCDTERKGHVNLTNADFAYYRGHMIDNRNLLPATGYLHIIWTFFGDCQDLHPNDTNVVFENVKFHRACTLSDNPTELHLVLDNGGLFEISENGSTVATGRISAYDMEKEAFTGFRPPKTDSREETFLLDSKDAYRELRLRGYNYKGQFRALHEVGSHSATIKWHNWVTFLDNMMQICILQKDTRALFVPTGLERLVICAKEHMKFLDASENNQLVRAHFAPDTKTVYTQFVEMRGLNAKSIARRKDRLLPVLETYQFVPNTYTTDMATSLRINMQLLLECKQTANFRMVEVLGDSSNADITHAICDVIEDIPLVIPSMHVLTYSEKFTMENVAVIRKWNDANLMVVCRDPTISMLKQAELAIIPDGFVLCLCTGELQVPPKFTLLTKHSLTDQRGTMYFLRRDATPDRDVTIVDASSNDNLDWLKIAQKILQNHGEVVMCAQGNSTSGIVGLTNCLIKETGDNTAKCVLVQDANVTFDLEDENDSRLMEQIKKDMPINIFKDGQWGTYRHLPLTGSERQSAYHWYAKAKNPGDLSSLDWFEGPITERTKDVVKPYKIIYSSLNFRDLMLASGKLSVEAITNDRFLQERMQGFEFIATDSNGQRVCGFGEGAIANMISKAYFTMPLPDWLKSEDAATVFIVYATIIIALDKYGRLKRGQSILIHSGTGGIGLAALNYCTYFDCEIYVTVGTQEKREYILKHYPHIPPSHIGNSRDTSFREMVAKESNGRGVDLVLNSLADEKLRASIDCLAFGGTFLEIGKYDLDKNNELFLDLIDKQCAYYAIMLDFMMLNPMPDLQAYLHDKITDGFAKGYVKPLPTTVFQIDQLEKAFKFMSTGKHIGKVLIQIDHERDLKVRPRFHCDPNCSYIIFGGLGGFGLELADWLILRGARYLVLASRSGITTGYQRYRISLWESYGVRIVITTDDVTDYNACDKLIESVDRVCPIDGIFNLAVVLQDNIFENQSIDTMRTSMAPKATLTRHADRITRVRCPNLRYFVVFSSVSCGRGNAGQTNYGFANSVMERICEERARDGLPALAVQWGAVGDVGLLEQLQKEHHEIAIGGTLQQKVTNCLEVFDQLIQQRKPIVSSMVVAEKFNKGLADTPLKAVIKILGVHDVKLISPHTPFPELGMDSMMAVEIKQTLEREFDILLAPNDLRNLTFAKLEDLTPGYGKDKKDVVSSNADVFALLIPGVILAKMNRPFVEFGAEFSTGFGDFILVFPGIDADIRHYEGIAKATKRHLKCVSYDAISHNQENVDVIVEFVYNALREEVTARKSFEIMAHSVGTLAAIELIRKLEGINITGKLVLIDGAPTLLYALLVVLAGNSVEEFECNVIESLVNITLPQESTIGLKEILMKGENLMQRIGLMVDHYSHASAEIKDLFKTLTLSLVSRTMSVVNYKARASGAKLRSRVALYRPEVRLIKDIADDYDLAAICTNFAPVRTFAGNHVTILTKDKMHQQLLIDFAA